MELVLLCLISLTAALANGQPLQLAVAKSEPKRIQMKTDAPPLTVPIQAGQFGAKHGKSILRIQRDESGQPLVTTGNGSPADDDGDEGLVSTPAGGGRNTSDKRIAQTGKTDGPSADATPAAPSASTPSTSPDSGKPAQASSPASATTGSGAAAGEETVSPLEQKGPIENIDNISPSAPSEEQQKVTGVIRYEEARQQDTLKAELTIFEALDEALVRGPRGAAIRALLPVAKSAYARATQQAPVGFNYDNGVWAEFTRRMGVTSTFEMPPWNVAVRLLSAKYLVQQQKYDRLTSLWQLRGDVRAAYTEVVVAQESLQTLNDLWDLARRLRIVSEKRFQAGDVPELDVLKSRTAEAQADIDRAVAYRRVVRAKQQLNVILGRTTEHAVIVPRLPSFLTLKSEKALESKNPLMPEFARPVPPLDHYMDIAQQNRYELKSLDRRIKWAKNQYVYSLWGVLPDIPLWYGASRTGNVPTGPKMGAFYVGFNVPSQITSFSQGDIAMYRATIRRLRYQYDAQRNQVQANVSSAYNNLIAARQKMRIYEEHVLADSEEVTRLARRSYEVGQSDITSTIQSMQNNVQVRLAYLDAITNYTGSLTDLEKACGMPLLSADDWY